MEGVTVTFDRRLEHGDQTVPAFPDLGVDPLDFHTDNKLTHRNVTLRGGVGPSILASCERETLRR